jgi:large subunit ribosomal protein L6
MSRIGKQEIQIPKQVKLKREGDLITATGPLGELSFTFSKLLKINFDQEKVLVTINENTEDRKVFGLWGMSRTVLDNMIKGVSVGFKKILQFNGVGYKANISGDLLGLSLGFSHPVEFKLPKGINAKVAGNTIELSGASKELLGLTAAKIRSFRPPEPYKGKGLKYIDETIIRKAGKTGGKK